MEMQENISLEINRSRIGTDIKVIVDRKEGEYYAARTEFDSPEVDNEVLIRPGRNKIVPGRFYTVRISGAAPYDLYSE